MPRSAAAAAACMVSDEVRGDVQHPAALFDSGTGSKNALTAIIKNHLLVIVERGTL